MSGEQSQEQSEQRQAHPHLGMELLQQLADGSAKRHSLNPPVSDFIGGGNAAEVQLALGMLQAQGLVESITQDGVEYYWQLPKQPEGETKSGSINS